MKLPANVSESTKRRNPDLCGLVSRLQVNVTDLHPNLTREGDLHNQIIEACKSRGWIALHGSTAHRTYRTQGEPDFVILADQGRVFFIECKTKTGKLTIEQKGLQMWAAHLGHTVHVVRTIQEFEEITR